ncbi:MAG: hypothetical protein ACRDOY_04445 [Nocardioidaceae bacterium]
MKTGTTYLQHLMGDNKGDLLRAGYLFPGDEWVEQSLATRDILGRGRKVSDPELATLTEGMWDRLSREMLSHKGRASIFSMEFLSFAGRQQAARIVQRSLSSAVVHVVLTVRDAVGAIPAQWQTRCRNQGTLSWPEFVHQATLVGTLGRAAPGEGAQVYRRAQDIPRMLDVWGRVVPAKRIHVVTCPPSSADSLLLWRRFAQAVGVDPAVASEPPDYANPSIGQASADLMRRINAMLGDLPALDHRKTLKRHLATILGERAGLESRPRLDLATLQFAADWNRRVREAVVDSGAQLIGDLEELPTRVSTEAAAAAAATLSDPSEDELLAAAATAREGMSDLVRIRMKLREKRGGGEDDNVDVPLDSATQATDRNGQQDAVSAAVTEVAALCRRAIDLRRQLDKLRVPLSAEPRMGTHAGVGADHDTDPR